jgi:hypothetical protein
MTTQPVIIEQELEETRALSPRVEAIALPFADREDVRELTKRLMHFHPAANKFGQAVMLKVAQLSIAHGANPFPGPSQEVHVWEGGRQKVNGQWVDAPPVIYFGIHFYRRKAREIDAIAWSFEPRVMTPEERKAHHIPAEAIAAICSGSRVSEMKAMRLLGAEFKEARESTRRTGMGVIKVEEMSKRDGTPIDPPRGRTWEWVACKRAEMDFYRSQSLLYAGAIDLTLPDIQLAEPTALAPEPAALSDWNPQGVDELNEALYG